MMKKSLYIYVLFAISLLCFAAIAGIYIYCYYQNAFHGGTFFFTGEISVYQIVFSLICIGSIVFSGIFAIKTCSKAVSTCRWICMIAILCNLLFAICLPNGIDFAGYNLMPGHRDVLFLSLPFIAFLATKYKKVTGTTILLVFILVLAFFLPTLFILKTAGRIKAYEAYAISGFFMLFCLSIDRRFSIGVLITISICVLAFTINFQSIISSNYARLAEAMTPVKSFMRNTPLVGETVGVIDNFHYLVMVFGYDLSCVPLLYLFKYGWAAYLLLLIFELSIVYVLVYFGKRARSSFGKYVCYSTAIMFLTRTLMYYITSFIYPTMVFLPFQGDPVSVFIDILLMQLSLIYCTIRIPKSLQIVDLDPSAQISFSEAAGFLFHALKSALKRMNAWILKRIFRKIIPILIETETKEARPSLDSYKENSSEPEKTKTRIKRPTDNYAKKTTEGAGKSKMSDAEKKIPKKVFLSYSWDDSEHKKWVYQLSLDLSEETGIQTILDQKDLVLGDPIPQFMEQSIECSDYVIIICTPNYKNKADRREGGVGYEDSIITGDLYSRNNHRKYIPILARGTWKEAIPTWAKGKLGVDMTTPDNYLDGLKKLKSTIVKGKL